LQAQADPDGRVTAFQYDSYGQVIRRTYHNGDNETYANDIRGDRTSHTDARRTVTNFEYNDRRQLTKTTVMRSVGNIVTQFIYDDVGNLWQVIDPKGNAIINNYSATQKLLTKTLPSLPSGTPVLVNTYDNRDKLQSTANPLNQTTYFGYDPGGRLIGMMDPLRRITRHSYDNNNRLASVTSPLSSAEQKTTYAYNGRGERVALLDAAGFGVVLSVRPER